MVTLWEDTPISVYKLIFLRLSFNWINTLEQTFSRWGFPHVLTKLKFLQMWPRDCIITSLSVTLRTPKLGEPPFLSPVLPGTTDHTEPQGTGQHFLKLPYSSSDFPLFVNTHLTNGLLVGVSKSRFTDLELQRHWGTEGCSNVQQIWIFKIKENSKGINIVFWHFWLEVAPNPKPVAGRLYTSNHPFQDRYRQTFQQNQIRLPYPA